MFSESIFSYRALGLLLFGAAVASAQGTLSISGTPLLKGLVRIPYRQTVSATGGNQPYAWTVNAGTLPPGLTVSAASGIISGTPATAGSYRFTVQVADVTNAKASTTFLIEIVQQIQPALFSGEQLPDAVGGKIYNFSLSANGATPPYIWTANSGFPPGITINSAGLIGGSASTSGIFHPIVTLQDSGIYGSTCCTGKSVTVNYELKVSAPLAINAVTPPNASTNVPYSTTISAIGRGSDSGFRWTVITGTLPDGLALVTNPDATAAINITGTPSRPGSFTFTLQAANTFGETATLTRSIRVSSPLLLTTTSLPNGGVNAPYSQTLANTGGASPFSWTATPAAFVLGLTLEATTGIIRGTPTQSGTFTFQVTIIDAIGATQSKQFQITITPAIGTVNVPTGSLNFNWQVGATTPPAQSFSITTTNPALVPTISSSAAWLTATQTGGTITASVNPTSLAAGSHTASLIVTTPGATNSSITIPVVLTILAAPIITGSPTAITFTYQLGGSVPASQSLSLSSSPAAAFTATSGASWLQVAAGGSSTPATATISVNPAGMTAGTYVSVISLNAAGAIIKQTVSVSLIITSAATLVSSSTQLSFAYQTGASEPIPQQFSVTTSTSTPITVTSNSPWLTVTTSSAATPAILTVSVSHTGLAAGSYTASISVTSSRASNSPLNIPVTFAITILPTATVTPSTVNFDFLPNDRAPQSQTISIAATLPTSFTITSSAAWLTTNASTGTSPAAIGIIATPASLAPGTYAATITITIPAAVISTVVVPITLTIRGEAALTTTPNQLTFSASVLDSQSILLTSSNPTPFSVSTTGTDWVYAIPSSSSTPATITVNASGAGLAPGTYTGNIIITAPGATNSRKTIAVTLTVGAIASTPVTTNPSQLTFTQATSGGILAPQTFTVASAQPVQFALLATSDPWLTATASGTTTPATVTVSVNPKGLTAGNFNGSVTIAAGGVQQTIPISLVVGASSPPLSIPTTQLTFTAQSGTGLPPPQVVRLTSSTPTNYTATTSGEPWLVIDPGTRVTPGSITVSIKTAGLTEGTYNASISVVAANTGRTQTISVALNILAPELPTFTAAAIVNAANYIAGMVPGSLVTLFGKNLSSVNGVAISGGRTTESGTSVRVGGILAPLLAVVNQQGQEQISFQVPFELTTNTTTVEVVTKFGSLSIPAIPLLVTQPGIFELREKPDGPAPAAAIHVDGTIISTSAPAKRNEIISLYFTGAGSIRPAVATGRLGPVPPSIMALPLVVAVNDVACEVLFAGYAPASLGLYQVNFRIPANAQISPATKLNIRINGVLSQATTLAIQ